MPRSLRKGPYVEPKLMAKIERAEASGDKRVNKTWSRRTMITPRMVWHTLAIHNGRAFLPVYITENMVGHKLGEFAPTRTFRSHGGKTAKVLKK